MPRRRVIFALATVAVVVGGAFLYAKVIRERVFPKRWGVVEAGQIYRSGQLHPALIERTLAGNGIDVIVDLNQPEPDNAAQRAEEQAAAKLKIERQLFPLIGDGTGDIEQYAQAIARMVEARRADQTVLVHCSAGTYRTGGVVACYRMLVEGWTPERARDEMLEYRWTADDATLPRYLNEHMAELAARLVELGAIEREPQPLPTFPEPGESSIDGKPASIDPVDPR